MNPSETSEVREGLSKVLARLRRDLLLLFTDPEAPSVVSTITGSPPRGSWFSHRMATSIFHVGELLEDHSEVIAVPLLRHKVTLVHRTLWPELFAVATSCAPWQLDSLPSSYLAILEEVNRQGEVNAHQTAPAIALAPRRTVGDLARALERRLLVYGRSVHSPTGRHQKILESWNHLQDRRGIRISVVPAAAALTRLAEVATRALAGRSAQLPWQTNR